VLSGWTSLFALIGSTGKLTGSVRVQEAKQRGHAKKTIKILGGIFEGAIVKSGLERPNADLVGEIR
jgi:hypothetical protein